MSVALVAAWSATPAWGQFTNCAGGVCYTGGNVGIGTTTPPQALTVSPGNIGSGLGIGWNHTTGLGETDFYNYAQGGAGGFAFYNYSANGAAWPTGSPQDLMTILSNGNVGIGTPWPAALLDVEAPNSSSYNTQLIVGQGSGLQFNIGRLSASGYLSIQGTQTGYNSILLAPTSGNVGIGTTNPQYLLSVKGTIGAQEVIVTTTGWSDYVFQPTYRLRPLTEVAAYIQENHHLPDIPTEAEVKEKGVSLGDMQVKLLAKVEELTLHMIEADERNKSLEQQNQELRERISRIEAAEKGK